MPLFDQLYNFAHWLTHNRDEAEDLVQETYVKALKGFSSFQLGTNFRAWMYRILRNTFWTSRTGLKATMTVPLDSEGDEPEIALERETPETILIERSNWQLVHSAIDQLPVHFREILLLCEVEEMFVPGDCGNTFHSDGHCDVTLVACQKDAGTMPTAGIAEGAEPWSASRGRHNSTHTSTVNFPRMRCASLTVMYVSALHARWTPLGAYR